MKSKQRQTKLWPSSLHNKVFFLTRSHLKVLCEFYAFHWTNVFTFTAEDTLPQVEFRFFSLWVELARRRWANTRTRRAMDALFPVYFYPSTVAFSGFHFYIRVEDSCWLPKQSD